MPPPRRPPLGEVAKRGALALVSSVGANLLVAGLALRFLPIPSDFGPLGVVPVALFTALGAVGATIAWAAIARRADRPVRAFGILSVVVLALSFLPDVGLLVAPERAPFRVDALGVYVLMVLHVVAWALILPSLVAGATTPRAAPPRADRPRAA